MRRRKSLNIQFVWTIFLILVSTSLISGLIFLLFMKIGIIKSFSGYPMLRLGITLFSCVIIGTIISMIVSKRILKPINDLVKGTEEIAKGNFDIYVENTTVNNELSALIDSFNSMASELKNVDTVHNDFITNFSHEFKTPMVSIRGFAKQLNNPDLSEIERQESVAVILEETERLSNLSMNILLLSKIENQQQLTLKKTAFYLDEQLRMCILLLQELWEEKNIDWSLELTHMSIVADEELLTQLWLNLIKNAIKYSEQNGVISISCYAFGSDIKVIVKDNGVGMSDYERRHVFDKFYQGDASHHTMGNGLGLTIAARIVQLHSGKINVKSKEYEGATFITILPTK
ncbi:ATP-binding protein [Enterococcus sp. AZ192]|uniref:HAMP domain-containing sensor histidine kinase n=1 Tax=unclassified Enterococcus TaxID=2608891 RepID=UPI003D277B15